MIQTVAAPRAGHDRLCAAEEDSDDLHAAPDFKAWIAAGEEEPVPSHVADRLFAGTSPPRVWGEYRDRSRSKRARVSGVNRVRIVEIEAGRDEGSVKALRKLAVMLDVTMDDNVPG